jgi:hypothetical protein
MCFSLLLILAGSVGVLQAQATPQVPVVLTAGVFKDPQTHTLDIGILAFKSTDAVSVKFQGRVHALQVFKRSPHNTTWLWHSGSPFMSGKCYTYTVIATTNGTKRSITVSSKTKNGYSLACKA